jgi:hypothetical protein
MSGRHALVEISPNELTLGTSTNPRFGLFGGESFRKLETNSHRQRHVLTVLQIFPSSIVNVGHGASRRLTALVHRDIETVFQSDQLPFDSSLWE